MGGGVERRGEGGGQDRRGVRGEEKEGDGKEREGKVTGVILCAN